MRPVYTIIVPLQCRRDCLYIKLEHIRVSTAPYSQRLLLCMDVVTFCDSLSALGPPCGPFHLEITELSCSPPLRGSPPPPPSTPI